jgi:hypothetical protein
MRTIGFAFIGLWVASLGVLGDSRSDFFQANVLPGFLASVPTEGVASHPHQHLQYELYECDDPTLHEWVRLYFVHDGTERLNSVGFGSLLEGWYEELWPEVSNTALDPGDFIDVTQLDGKSGIFFVLAAGVLGDEEGGQSYTTLGTGYNPDLKNHFAVLDMDSGLQSTFWLIGVEDSLDLGDGDFNDAMFALEIHSSNGTIPSCPEPHLAWLLFSFLGIVVYLKKGRFGRVWNPYLPQ